MESPQLETDRFEPWPLFDRTLSHPVAMLSPMVMDLGRILRVHGAITCRARRCPGKSSGRRRISASRDLPEAARGGPRPAILRSGRQDLFEVDLSHARGWRLKRILRLTGRADESHVGRRPVDRRPPPVRGLRCQLSAMNASTSTRAPPISSTRTLWVPAEAQLRVKTTLRSESDAE